MVLDLDGYLSGYTGVTRLRRLNFIAKHEESLRREALRRGIEEVKQTSNTSCYIELLSVDPTLFPRDDAWVESVDKRASQTLEKMEADLASHKSSLVKDSIRVCTPPPHPRTTPHDDIG